jgi:hypothetical protein
LYHTKILVGVLLVFISCLPASFSLQPTFAQINGSVKILIADAIEDLQSNDTNTALTHSHLASQKLSSQGVSSSDSSLVLIHDAIQDILNNDTDTALIHLGLVNEQLETTDDGATTSAVSLNKTSSLNTMLTETQEENATAAKPNATALPEGDCTDNNLDGRCSLDVPKGPGYTCPDSDKDLYCDWFKAPKIISLGIKDCGTWFDDVDVNAVCEFFADGTIELQPIAQNTTTPQPLVGNVTDGMDTTSTVISSGPILNENATSSETGNAANFKVYENPIYGFKIQYPSNWEEQEFNRVGTNYIVKFNGPPLRFGFGITILDELYGGTRYKDINDLFEARLSTEGVLNSEIFRHIRGYPSYTESTEGGGSIITEYGIMANNLTYLLSWEVLDSQEYNQFLPVAQKMVDSFEITNTPDVAVSPPITESTTEISQSETTDGLPTNLPTECYIYDEAGEVFGVYTEGVCAGQHTPQQTGTSNVASGNTTSEEY